uniref:Allophycocyanin beta 18 subunit n=1 Tax=Kuetzingia canaliculata TaxID=228262 RepID=A0A1Z1MPQ8_KUECA|nr:allophycocyanin beta 18 subunit [Kuetzingia canaliculata]ARW67832.1 allophycocyanin beta 18 subunit [Kuetzingia canaliculata]
MKDAITNIVNNYDITGKYFDDKALNDLDKYFKSGIDRLKILELISSKASTIVKEAATRLYSEQPELLRPGGNSYTTRRYATCLRDIDYYLRYASYALIAASTDVLNERLLDGLKETYISLNVPVGPTIRSIQILKEIIINESKRESLTIKQTDIITQPFDYISMSLSEQNI